MLQFIHLKIEAKEHAGYGVVFNNHIQVWKIVHREAWNIFTSQFVPILRHHSAVLIQRNTTKLHWITPTNKSNKSSIVFKASISQF